MTTKENDQDSLGRVPITYQIPVRRVVRMQANPEGNRYYAVVQKMQNKDGTYGGWLHVSKGYAHSTSAFAALGRLVQKDFDNLGLNITAL